MHPKQGRQSPIKVRHSPNRIGFLGQKRLEPNQTLIESDRRAPMCNGVELEVTRNRYNYLK